MINDIATIHAETTKVLRKSIRQIFMTHLAYVALGMALFTPLSGVVGQLLLRLSGQPVLSDMDIAYFLLSPFGIVALILFSALLITIFVWTVNDQVSMSRMMSLGVDGLITDEPELANKVLIQRSELSSIERLLIHTSVLIGQPIPQRLYRDQSP